MSIRTTAILFGVIFLLGIGLLILSFTESDDAPTKELLLSNLAGAKEKEIDTVEIEKGPSRIVFKRADGDNWTITEPVATRAEAGSVKRIIDALLAARPTSYPELNSNPAVHGLDTPGLRVTLRAADKSDTLNLGDVTGGGGKSVAFVTTSQRKRPMAVTRGDLDALFKESKAGSAGDLAKWTNDYRVKQVFGFNPQSGTDDIVSVKLNHAGKELVLTKSAAGTWQFVNPAGWGDAAMVGDLSNSNPSAITGVRALLNTLLNLQAAAADDFIDRGNPKEFGLDADNKDRITVELKDKNGVVEKAVLAKKSDPPPAPATPKGPLPPAPPARLYVQVDGSSSIVRTNPPPTLDGLLAAIANPDPLRDRDLIKDSDKTGVDAIDIVAGGQTTKLRKSGGQFGKWQLYGGPNDPQDANPAVIAKLLSLLSKPGVIKDFPASSDANFTPAETRAEIKLWVNGTKPNTDPKAGPNAEPKVEGPPILLQFGKKDPDSIFVRRTLANGTKTDFRLPERVKIGGGAGPQSPFGDEIADVVATVTKNRLDFLDTSLKSFSPLQANKLIIQNGANVALETVKEKSADMFAEPKWKYVLPAAQKDRPADAESVNDLLQVLGTATMAKYISESDSDLAKWGLDPKNPKLKVTIGLDSGPAPPPLGEKKDKPDSERIWYFGNETEDKLYVYARQEGKPAVFTIIKVIADRLASADVRDRTVASFNRTKAKKLTLKGWKDKSGFELELVFEKNKDGVWTATKSPGAYTVDPAKVERFLETVNGLRARTFVSGPVKPEQKIPPSEGGLQAIIDIDGAPTVMIFIGGPADDTSVYLQALTLPSNADIVTVPAEAFKAFKESSAAFAK